MKLNLGCGYKKRDGFHNVDMFADCTPDEVVDLEHFPWPWPDDSVDEVIMSHVLEHLGAETGVYFNIFRELYRVCQHDAVLNSPFPIRVTIPSSPTRRMSGRSPSTGFPCFRAGNARSGFGTGWQTRRSP